MKRAALLVLCAAAPAWAAPSTGTIEGTVGWKGKAPDRKPIDRGSDPVCDKTWKASEDVIVEGGKVKDVLVRITVGGVPTATAPAVVPPPAVITQHECMYAPRVVGIVLGQAVEVRNADATFHNVRGNLGAKVLWNLGQPAAAPAIERTDIGKPGDVVALKCDVHPWMSSWIAVSDHPFFTVTGADGAFLLRDVPPGTYTVEAWHPTLGVKTTKVKVKKGKAARAKFTFAAK